MLASFSIFIKVLKAFFSHSFLSSYLLWYYRRHMTIAPLTQGRKPRYRSMPCLSKSLCPVRAMENEWLYSLVLHKYCVGHALT